MNIIFCKEFGTILSNPTIKSDSFIGFDEKKIAGHIQNCEKCKKGLKMFYDSKSETLPFTLKMFADKFINKLIGE